MSFQKPGGWYEGGYALAKVTAERGGDAWGVLRVLGFVWLLAPVFLS